MPYPNNPQPTPYVNRDDHPFAPGRCAHCGKPNSAVYCLPCYRREQDGDLYELRQAYRVLAEHNATLRSQLDGAHLYVAELERLCEQAGIRIEIGGVAR